MQKFAKIWVMCSHQHLFQHVFQSSLVKPLFDSLHIASVLPLTSSFTHSIGNFSHVGEDSPCRLTIALADLLVVSRNVPPALGLDKPHVLVDALRGTLKVK